MDESDLEQQSTGVAVRGVMKGRTTILLPLAVAFAVVGLVAWTGLGPFVPQAPSDSISADADLDKAVAKIDDWFAQEWIAANVEPAEPANDLQVFRRLSLALVGSVPSLEEIREFEADKRPDRMERWTARLIADSRFVEYFPTRLADGLVNPMAAEVENRHRWQFANWLGIEIQRGRPYDEIVRHMVADRGMWGDHPASTFAVAELKSGDQAAERLAARTSRFFLGQRIDCAQCHDHPFDDWTQQQFEGLAAHFSEIRLTAFGVQDTRRGPLMIEDPDSQQPRAVEPRAPFGEEWVSDDGRFRDQLADWVTHKENRRFRRAIANRMWGLMFGRPLVTPVDDIPDPPPAGRTDSTAVLDILGDDLSAHDYDLRRMIHVIAASRTFRLASTHPQLDDADSVERLENHWAVFPLSQLRPVQLIRSMQQASSIRTLRVEQTGTYAAMMRYVQTHEFIERYGMMGADDDSTQEVGTIPQTAERLVGGATREFSEASLLNAPGRIAALAGSNKEFVENLFLACLTRRPTDDERVHFLAQLGDAGLNRRAEIAEDIYWTLFNSAEFCWNH